MVASQRMGPLMSSIVLVNFLAAALLVASCDRFDEQPVTTFTIVKMGEITYRVPHFDTDPAGKDLTKDNNINVDIQFVWPGYVRRSEREQIHNWAKYKLNEMSMSVDNSEYSSLAAKAKRVRSWYDEWDEVSGPANLVQMRPLSSPTPKFVKRSANKYASTHEYYFAQSFGRATDIIDCLDDPRARSNRYYWCSHTFEADGFTWTLRYDVAHLENWRWLRAEAINRVKSWQIDDTEVAGQVAPYKD